MPIDGFTWHDQQRIGQFIIAFFALLGLVNVAKEFPFPFHSRYQGSLAFIVLLGAVSAVFAKHPIYAFAEWSLLVISIGIGVFVFCLRRASTVSEFDEWLGIVLRLLLGSMVAQFYVSFIAVLAHPDLFFTPWMLLDGFSNMRQEGLFLAIATPLLLTCINFRSGGYSLSVPRWLDSTLIASLSCMVFVAGTRGTAIGWISAILILSILSKGGRSLAKRFLGLIAIGFVLAWFVLRAANFATGQEANFRFSGTQMLGLSGREALWTDAFNAMLSNPWLGIGPMHFAAIKNPIATHPHQALLQIGSEWGIPVLLITIGMILSWGWSALRLAIAKDGGPGADLRWAILIALGATAVQGLVDGVLVMPYVQIWLAIVLGWAASIFYEQPQRGANDRWAYRGLLILMLPALAVLFSVLMIDLPEVVGAAEYCSGGPRFWCNGRL